MERTRGRGGEGSKRWTEADISLATWQEIPIKIRHLSYFLLRLPLDLNELQRNRPLIFEKKITEFSLPLVFHSVHESLECEM